MSSVEVVRVSLLMAEPDGAAPSRVRRGCCEGTEGFRIVKCVSNEGNPLRSLSPMGVEASEPVLGATFLIRWPLDC